eukprot:Sspe_Gene.28826::Locus_13267_Transcript_1_1_Confidence_1.000_Length_530::g.28826::m.28826
MMRRALLAPVGRAFVSCRASSTAVQESPVVSVYEENGWKTRKEVVDRVEPKTGASIHEESVERTREDLDKHSQEKVVEIHREAKASGIRTVTRSESYTYTVIDA